MPAPIFFDDIQPNSRIVGPSVVIDEEEMVDFARKWDPVPIHVDKEAGKAAFGILTAPGVYVLAIKQRLLHELERLPAVILGSIAVNHLLPGVDVLRLVSASRPEARSGRC